jgi:hypothetical protein
VGIVVGSCKNGKGGEFVDYLSDYSIRKRDSAPRTLLI